MTTTTMRNGVDIDTVFATINAVAEQRELAEFQFRATNEWVAGAHSRTTISGFSGAGGDHAHAATFEYDADHPQVLVGTDNGPTPVEYLLVAIASCLTAGIAGVAAARKVDLTKVTSTVEGDINLLRVFGITDEGRNGYKSIRVNFEIEGDADQATLEAIVAQSVNRSAVYDVLTNGVPVVVNTNVVG